MSRVVEESTLGGGLMDINDWIDQALAAKDYIQAQEDREDFILRTGAGLQVQQVDEESGAVLQQTNWPMDSSQGCPLRRLNE